MKEAIVSKGPKVSIIDSPIPVPGESQVAIKVVLSGSNPKDWKRAEAGDELNTGDDIAGVVHTVGSNVVEFKPGDRVAAFHQMMAPHGSFAEYAVAEAHTTFHLPKQTSFEEGATLPLAAMTAAFGLYQKLNLPLPWHPTSTPIPLIIYGGASAVGTYAIQLASLSNIHPIIAVAGKGIPHVESYLDASKGDIALDYRVGNEKLVSNLQEAAQSKGKIEYAFDCISEHNSYQNICSPSVLDHSTGQITLIQPFKDYAEIPPSITKSTTFVGGAHKGTDALDSWQKKVPGTKVGNQEFAHAMFRFIARGLGEGWFRGMP
ncbi:MAG: hypothetical protein Q9191_005395, partial [Dirinaria sp. TL-2023a]